MRFVYQFLYTYIYIYMCVFFFHIYILMYTRFLWSPKEAHLSGPGGAVRNSRHWAKICARELALVVSRGLQGRPTTTNHQPPPAIYPADPPPSTTNNKYNAKVECLIE